MSKESKKNTPRFNNLFQKEKERKKASLLKKIARKKKLLGIVFIFILLGATVGIFILKPDWIPFEIRSKKEKALTPPPLDLEKSPKEPSGYQAVFLSNGQVYFGKLSQEEKTYAVLMDVYYLRSQQPLQEQETEKEKKDEKEKKEEETPLSQPNLTLIKLGKEVHGPMDEIRINKEHILFIEDLANDSRIVKAIEEYKK